MKKPCTALTDSSSPLLISGVVCREKAKQECEQVEKEEDSLTFTMVQPLFYLLTLGRQVPKEHAGPYATECLVCPGDIEDDDADTSSIDPSFIRNEGGGPSVIATISCKITSK